MKTKSTPDVTDAEMPNGGSLHPVVRSGYRVSTYDGKRLRNVINLGTPGDVADMIRNELERKPNSTIRVAPNGELSGGGDRPKGSNAKS